MKTIREKIASLRKKVEKNIVLKDKLMKKMEPIQGNTEEEIDEFKKLHEKLMKLTDKNIEIAEKVQKLIDSKKFEDEIRADG